MGCERCGSCCLQFGGTNFADEADLRRWLKEERIDILQYACGWNDWCNEVFRDYPELVIEYLTESLNAEFWFDPRTGNELSICPFLKKRYRKQQFKCSIHETKPQTCREYFCNPNDMKGIVKRPFDKNYREYRKIRREDFMFLRSSV